ncbi:MAG: ATP-dependent helicase, partial [Candidatus Bathyarchaeota archaeon]|nr:ATP-dependent helicase [Candidatus Bathyarchaeota archaeon]
VRDFVRCTFPHIQVDELQDTSLLQLTLVQLLYNPERSRVFAVADDDQMVYEWRDARPETLLEYENTFEADVVILRYNYRCPKNIVTVANCIIANNHGRREKIVTSKREDVLGRITLSHWSSQEDQASFITTQISNTTGDGDSVYQNYAVLVRYRQSLQAVQSALEESGIPFIEIGGRDVEDSPFVRILMGCLRLVAGQPYGQEAIRRACGKANQLLEGDVFQVKKAIAVARTIAQQFDRNLIHALARQLEVIATLENYGHDADAIRVRRFLDTVDLAKSESDWQDYPSMLRTLTFEFNSLQVRVNMQYDAIRLMTIHAAKGLQFPVVFIPDLSDGTFPNLRSRNRRPNLAEERRLLFVAITRAQEEAHLLWSDIGPYGYPADASPFIDEALQTEDGCIERLNE